MSSIFSICCQSPNWNNALIFVYLVLHACRRVVPLASPSQWLLQAKVGNETTVAEVTQKNGGFQASSEISIIVSHYRQEFYCGNIISIEFN